eukprot:2630268-Alexandrium_andersonii.AAC.1
MKHRPKRARTTLSGPPYRQVMQPVQQRADQPRGPPAEHRSHASIASWPSNALSGAFDLSRPR